MRSRDGKRRSDDAVDGQIPVVINGCMLLRRRRGVRLSACWHPAAVSGIQWVLGDLFLQQEGRLTQFDCIHPA